MSAPEESCVFCSIAFRDTAFAIGTRWFATYIPKQHSPASRGHALILPKRHIEDIDHCTPEEWVRLQEFITVLRRSLPRADQSILGYNFGANLGEAAGQSIAHLHFHLIPRRAGDSDEPIGIRNALRRCLKQEP